jgi:hypothetical protein
VNTIKRGFERMCWLIGWWASFPLVLIGAAVAALLQRNRGED